MANKVVHISKMRLGEDEEIRHKSDLEGRNDLSITSLSAMLGDLTDEEMFLDRVLDMFCSESKYISEYGKGNFKEGATPIGLRGLLAIVVFGKYRRVHSSRKLQALARENMVCRYLSGNVTPSHAAINEFIRNNGGIIEAFFSYTVQLASDNNLVTFDNVNVDGSKIKANASIGNGQMLHILIKKNENIKKAVQNYVKSILETDAAESSDAAEKDMYRRIAEETQVIVEARDEEIRQLRAKLDELWDNGTYSSCVNDPAARKMKSGHTQASQASQNIQVGVDSENNIVVAVDSTDSPSDINQIYNMSSLIKEEAERTGHTFREVTADKGYGNIGEIDRVESELGVSGNVDMQSVHKEWLSQNCEYTPDTDDPEHNAPAVTCPAGKRMTTTGRLLKQAKGCDRWAYTLRLSECSGCPLAAICRKGKKEHSPTKLYVSKYWYRQRQHLEKLKRPDVQHKIWWRKGHSESVFGYLKQELPYKALPRIGKKSGIVEIKFMSSIYNLKRIINVVYNRTKDITGIIVSKPSDALLHTSF